MCCNSSFFLMASKLGFTGKVETFRKKSNSMSESSEVSCGRDRIRRVVLWARQWGAGELKRTNAHSSVPFIVPPVLLLRGAFASQRLEVIWCSRYPTRPSVWLKNVWVRLSKEVWEKHLDSHTASNARLRSEEGSGFWMWRTFDRKVLENHKMERWIWKTKIRLFASVIWSLILKGRMCHHTIFLEKNIS